MYAQLCKRLSEDAPNFEPPGSKITTFKRLLLINCRDEFENRAAISATFERKSGTLTGEEEEAKFLAKRKMLGNIKFIGELGKLEMLHDSTIHKCCEHLLVGRKKQPIFEQAEDLECLAHLFKTCGRIIDSPKAKLLVDQYFQRIQSVINNHETPTRIKFLLQDVIDLRSNRWIPRKLASQDGPRPIQQVREDAARDGCIYLPQQDQMNGARNGDQHTTRLEEVLLSKRKGQGMEDIFGGPAPKGTNSLGTGPGVIGESSYNNYDNYSSNRNNHSPYETDKYNNINNSYNRDESRDYKPKRDNYENKYVERPDFGDRFTANRNKTHPSNRGRGGGGLGSGGGPRPNYSNGTGGGGGYNDKTSGATPQDKDLPPRFKKMTMYNGGGSNGREDRVTNSNSNGDIQLRPSNLMLKPKTPASLPKSARLDNGLASGLQPNNGAMTMNVLEPVYISSKKGGDKNKNNDKKNQGPTREEVFKRVEVVVAKLNDTGSTNEAFTVWKEATIPNKMVNNALIHLFKQVVKMEASESRDLAHQLIDQLVAEDIITHTHCKESLGRILTSGKDLAADEGIVHLTTWCLTSNKVKLVELADITDGGSTHPLFLSVLQQVAANSEQQAVNMLKDSGVKLLDQLPQALRTEEQLSAILEETKLTFLVPMLTIKSDLTKVLQQCDDTSSAPNQLQAWISSNVDASHQSDPAFVLALMDAIIRYIVDKTGTTTPDNNNTEKEMIVSFKTLIKSFLKCNELQLSCIYALQVYCFSAGFPKGLMLRWFMALYEADIIEESAFLKWKEDVNDSYPGKGKALFQVNQWLTWLEEAESEDEDDEE